MNDCSQRPSSSGRGAQQIAVVDDVVQADFDFTQPPVLAVGRGLEPLRGMPLDEQPAGVRQVAPGGHEQRCRAASSGVLIKWLASSTASNRRSSHRSSNRAHTVAAPRT